MSRHVLFAALAGLVFLVLALLEVMANASSLIQGGLLR
jgi:hypothetical protein